MTETLCIGLAIITAGFALVHLLLALWFRGWLRRQRAAAGSRGTGHAGEQAAVLVAARGLDQSVVEALRSLGRQSYSGFDVIAAADGWSQRDADALSGLDRLRVIEGWERLSTCGLKCSALRAAAGLVDSECRWVAFLDVDVAPGPDWLATLVGSAREPDGSGGAASGLQWFEPVGGSPGAWVRSLWNAAALFPTALFANPWAGSMVLRREWLGESGLVEDWARNIVDDGPVRAALARIGKQHRLAPQVVMTNVEACSLAGAANWLGRMVKWNSIYERNFVGTLLHAGATAAMLTGGVGLLVGGIMTGVGAVWWLAVSWGVGNSFYLAGWLVMRDAARSSERISVHQPARSLGAGSLLAGWCLVTVTQVLFCVAAFRSLVARTYRWRGMEYEVDRHGSVVAMREVTAG